MSKKDHRAGGKFNSRHTTVIPAAGILVDAAAKQEDVYNISLGFIKNRLKSVNGQRRVKFTREQGCVLLAIRDNTSHQEVSVFTRNVQETCHNLARFARDRGIHISFAQSTTTV